MKRFLFSRKLGALLAVPLALASTAAFVRADTKSAEAQQVPIFSELEKFVQDYFPKAKFVMERERMHFEFKVHNYQNQYSNRQELAPDNGGIIGDLQFKTGEYKGSEKLPKEQNQYFYTSLTMAPYNKEQDKNLYCRLGYPPDTPMEFLDGFKDLIGKYGVNTAAMVEKPLAQPTQAAATAPAIAAPSATTAPVAQPSAVPAAVGAAVSPAVALQPRKLFFWKATRGNEVIYLLGTIHIAMANFYPLATEIDEAFDQSKDLIVEVAIDRHHPDQATIHQLVESCGMYTPPDKLSKHLSAETKKIFDDYLNWAGESWAMYEQYKPWYVNNLVEASLPRRGDILKIKGSFGLDNYFLFRARENNKNVDELETVDFQLHLHSKLSDEVQDKLLQTTLLKLKDAIKEVTDIFDAWKAGDPNQMGVIVNKVVVEHPDLAPYNSALLDQRNVGMVNKIEQWSKTGKGPLFVAVGSAHLIGNTGLVEALKKRGFEVQQVVAEVPPKPPEISDLTVFGEDHFKARFPLYPERRTHATNSKVTQYEHADGENGIYSIVSMDIPVDQSKLVIPGPLLLDKVLSSVTAAMNATSIVRHTTAVDGAVCRSLVFTVGPPPAAAKPGQPVKKTASSSGMPDEIFFTHKPQPWFTGKTVRAKAMLAGNKIYVCLVCGSKTWADSADVIKFMNSFQIIR